MNTVAYGEAVAYVYGYIPVKRSVTMVKWFGVPASLDRMILYGGFASVVGCEPYDALGRVVHVLAWLAMESPEGFLPEEMMLGRIAGFRGQRARRFGTAFHEYFADEYGRCVPYLEANAALVKNRDRQRVKQQERRARRVQ